jgi:hypothetical protein
MSDETCLFAVFATHEGPNRWSRPYFVRAGTLAEAYINVIEEHRSLFQHPHIRLEGFVIGLGELPDMKRVAKAWWRLAYQNANNPNKGAEEDFDELWDEHGADPDENTDPENP